MKTSNTLSNKQLYGMSTGIIFSKEVIKESARSLQPIESISKDDVIEIGEFLYQNKDKKEVKLVDLRQSIINCVIGKSDVYWSPLKMQQLFDFLRPTYATPWRDLSINDLIEYKWLVIEA